MTAKLSANLPRVKPKCHTRKLKYISLITLTTQNAILSLSMRYSQTRGGDRFINSTAVATTEVVKLLTCLYLVLRSELCLISVSIIINKISWIIFVHIRDENHSLEQWRRSLHEKIWGNKMDTLKVGIPSLIYLVQNNLLYVAAGNLDVATYQIM